MLAIGGPAWSFLVNSLSYAPAVLALSLIRVPRLAPTGQGPPNIFKEAAAAVRYVSTHLGIRRAILIAGVVAFFGQPIIHLVVIFANDVFRVGEMQYGILAAAGGVGAMLNTPFVATRGTQIPRSRLLGLAWPAYGLALLGFALSPYYWLAVAALAVLGAAHIATASSLNTVIQLQVEEALRAKVLAPVLDDAVGGHAAGHPAPRGVGRLDRPPHRGGRGRGSVGCDRVVVGDQRTHQGAQSELKEKLSLPSGYWCYEGNQADRNGNQRE